MANQIIFDRVKMTVTGTPGTSSITLNAADSGYRTFAGAGVSNGNVVRYLIEDGSAWEYGLGTYTSSGTSLSRDTVTASSSGGSKISCTASATVYITGISADVVQFDSAGNVIIPGTTSGNITIAPPAAAGSNTLTLPARTGTLLTTVTPGTILQVVQGTTSTQVQGTSTTYTDTNLTATITPSSATNKVLVIVNQQLDIYNATGSVAACGIKLVRGSTDILLPVTDATGPFELESIPGAGTYSEFTFRVPITYLDSPSTTSATTYKTQVRSYAATTRYTCQYNSSTNGTSTIILMEVAA